MGGLDGWEMMRCLMCDRRFVCLLVGHSCCVKDVRESSPSYSPSKLRDGAVGDRGHCCDSASALSPWESAHRVLEAGGVPVVRVWAPTKDAGWAHLGMRTPHAAQKGGDCTHCHSWRTPGVADVFARLILFAMQEHCPSAMPTAIGAKVKLTDEDCWQRRMLAFVHRCRLSRPSLPWALGRTSRCTPVQTFFFLSPGA